MGAHAGVVQDLAGLRPGACAPADRRARLRHLWHFPAMALPEDDRTAACADRRRVLLGGLSVALAATLPARRLLAATTDAPRSLSFVHTHTGEQLSVTYFQSGAYDDAALTRINVLLRDFRNEAVHRIDPQLLDALHALRCQCNSSEPFQIISGYRSPATNATLRGKSEASGVAEHSLHMEGRAIDIRLPGLATRQLAMQARALQVGGVGYYRVSDFVHVDTGRVRLWGDPVGT